MDDHFVRTTAALGRWTLCDKKKVFSSQIRADNSMDERG
jgi:hypothetical protein